MMLVRWLRRWVVRALIGFVLAALLVPSLAVFVYARIDPPLTPLMVIRWFEGEGLRYSWRPLAQISPELQRAVIAAEDNLFCRHAGFDSAAMRASLRQWRDGGRPRGASTITMQTAKNILLWPGRDPVRKLLEAWMTVQIEALWDKQRILEVYLNIAEMGAGIYGAETAARAYFRKTAKSLNAGESALLAAVLPNPRTRSVATPDGAVRTRARTIALRTHQLGPLLDCL